MDDFDFALGMSLFSFIIFVLSLVSPKVLAILNLYPDPPILPRIFVLVFFVLILFLSSYVLERDLISLDSVLFLGWFNIFMVLVVFPLYLRSSYLERLLSFPWVFEYLIFLVLNSVSVYLIFDKVDPDYKSLLVSFFDSLLFGTVYTILFIIFIVTIELHHYVDWYSGLALGLILITPIMFSMAIANLIVRKKYLILNGIMTLMITLLTIHTISLG